MKITDLIKNIAYLILLFGISALLIFLRIYDDNAERLFSFFVITGSVVLINGFSLIAVRKRNVFYAVSNALCFALWVYPLFIKSQYLLPETMGTWVFILVLAAFLPAGASCLFTLLYFIIIDIKKKKAGKRTLTAKKVLSIISIVMTCAAAVLFIICAVKLGIQIPKDIEDRKESYSAAADLAKEMAEEYKGSDLIIEEVLNKHQLTYDNPEESYYIIEETENISITINTSDSKDAEENEGNVICVSSESIGFGIEQLFAVTLYDGESQTISLLQKTE